MERMDRKSADKNDNVVDKPTGKLSRKIALVPFVEAEPPVHLLDATGKAYPARERSAEDDFQLAVRSLGTGNVDESKGDVDGTERKNGAAGGDDDAGEETRTRENGNVESKSEKKPTGNETAAGKPAPSPAEHPLQKAVTSFDMALGELNQLVHLVDLARAGEFMALERVTPSEEDQARAMPDQSARPGSGVPREALVTMVKLKRRHLKGAAAQLRQRAKRLRETTKVQRVFQQGVVHLRKRWRVVAPNHGKVDVPLQVGEALSVDCSFESAGGHSVPSTASAGTRHRHPWLFQLTCGEGGRLEAETLKGRPLKIFQVQVVSATTGLCEHSLKASFPIRGDACWRKRTGEAKSREAGEVNGGSVSECEDGGIAHMDLLEQHIARLQHSVFWEEAFETIKADALIDGKNGWLAHQDARCGPAGATGGVSSVGIGAKRRLLNVGLRGTTGIERAAEPRVVHVMDNEVMVEMNDQYLLGYRLLSWEAGSDSLSSASGASSPCAQGDASSENDGLEGSRQERLVSLCQLATLYCGSLLRQKQQQTQTKVAKLSGPKAETSRKTIAATSTESWVGVGTSVRQSTAGSTWKSVGRVLRHHVFRMEVIARLAEISRSLRRMGLPMAVRWTHLETTYPASSLSFTLGHCSHFRVALDDGCRAVVSALAGLHNHADQRSVELLSAKKLQQFLLGEICRQIVLTFGDVASAWTREKQLGKSCFRVDLTPAAIHLLPLPVSPKPVEDDGKSTEKGDEKKTVKNDSKSMEKGDGSSREVRVCVQKVELQIACSKWSSPCCTSNGRGDSSDAQDSPFKAKLEPFPTSLATVVEKEVTVAEWEKLEGRDVFRKFSNLLACLYPSSIATCGGK